MRSLGFLKRLVGLFPKQQARSPSGNHIEPSKPWPRKPTLAEQQLIVALDDVTEKLNEFRQKIERSIARPNRPEVIPAPQWLKDQMERIRAMPPATLEEVETQMRASAERRRELDYAEFDPGI